MSEENVAIVKSAWAGWRQGLRTQWVRDLEEGVAERMSEWEESSGAAELQPEEFVDAGDVVLVRARSAAGDPLWFRYTLRGPRIVDWDAHADEREAREAAGL